MGRNLKADGVVASRRGVHRRRRATSPTSTGIQVGLLPAEEGDGGRRRARASWSTRTTSIQNTVTIPEGLAGRRHRRRRSPRRPTSPRRSSRRSLDDPDGARAARLRRGQPRGLPVPGDLRLRPERRRRRRCSRDDGRPLASRRPTTPTSRPRADDARLHAARADDRRQPGRGRGAAARTCRKVARVIYNRLETGDATTNGLLQIDATVNYAADQRARRGRRPTEDLEIDSPYNTYMHTGPAAGPIEAPGDDGDRGGAQPGRRATGSTTSRSTCATGETKFAETYDEFLELQGRAAASTARPSPTPAEHGHAVRRPG